MSKFGKSIVVIGWVLVLASCATPDANRAATQRPQAGRGRGEPGGTLAGAVVVPAADTDAMAAVIRTALVCAVLACAGCSVADAPPTQFAAPAMGGGGNDGGNGGGMGGGSGGM